MCDRNELYQFTKIDIDKDQGIAYEILPYEILLKIFSFLDKIELHMTAALVSKKWLYLTRDPSLTKKVELSDRTTGGSVISMLSWATMLKDLSIYYRDDVNMLLQTMAQFSGRQLETLLIHCCKSLTEECTKVLQENCTNLKSFEITGYWLNGMIWKGTDSYIATSHLTKIRSLVHIELSLCKYLLPQEIKNIAQNCDNLQSVILNDNPGYYFTDESIDKLLFLRKETLKIIYLHLDAGTYLSANAFSNLSACIELEELEIRTEREYARNLWPIVLKEVSKLTKLKRCNVETLDEDEQELDE